MKENHGDGSQRYQSTEQNPTTHTTLFFPMAKGKRRELWQFWGFRNDY